jgi:serine/threonine protein kinase
MIEVGQIIGNYRIIAKLGEGGMGVVYLAEHPIIGRKVALKAIHPELSRNLEVVSRFKNEAKSVNQIGNEHIVDVSDFGETPDGEFYFIMEFLQGESLADRLRRERFLQVNRALHIATQVADALAASHAHGIVHRDLKPENIFLITRGQAQDFVKVLDFGLAKLTQGDEKVSHKTRTGSVMGTPYYMSPEQCEGKAAVDHRADVYSLGVILFEMVTGRVPFGGEGYGEIIVKHLTVAPPAPREINPAITPAEEAVVLHALTKSRAARFGSMQEFRAAMLDPEEFVRISRGDTPPAPAIRIGEASGSLSLRRLEGAEDGESSDMRRVPMPSTFRHAGEVLDGEIELPRSRKGLVIGVVAAAALAAGAAAFVVNQRNQRSPDTLAAASAAGPPAPSNPTVPAAAMPVLRKVRLSFVSDPSGAAVLAKSTGETLGTTPFEREFLHGRDPLEFIFRKARFDDQESLFVPEFPGTVSVTLRATASGSPANALAEVGSSRSASGTAPKSSSARGSKPPRPRKPAGSPKIDEDAVLEPSFNN